MVGRGLSLFAETSVSSRLGGLCNIPSPSVDQIQSQSQSKTRGGTRHRWASPEVGVANRLTTLGVARSGRRQR